jgi:hypothetical protein
MSNASLEIGKKPIESLITSRMLHVQQNQSDGDLKGTPHDAFLYIRITGLAVARGCQH